MSEIKLFRLHNGIATDIQGSAGTLEKSLQTLMEKNLETLLSVRFIASEYSTGRLHRGRIDTLGLDENNCPVILEYKRAISENVVSQGLYYFDWLMDHKGDYKLLVLDRCGRSTADAIDWTSPRLICVAADFTKHDEHAVRQMDRNIDLVRYRRFGSDLLVLELLTSTSASPLEDDSDVDEVKPSRQIGDKPVAQSLEDLDLAMKDVWIELRDYILSLGGDVTEKPLKLYIAFRRIRNFATVVVAKKALNLYLHIDAGTVDEVETFVRDVTDIGHWGTGNVEVRVTDKATLQKALPLVLRAYEGS